MGQPALRTRAFSIMASQASQGWLIVESTLSKPERSARSNHHQLMTKCWQPQFQIFFLDNGPVKDGVGSRNLDHSRGIATGRARAGWRACLSFPIYSSTVVISQPPHHLPLLWTMPAVLPIPECSFCSFRDLNICSMRCRSHQFFPRRSSSDMLFAPVSMPSASTCHSRQYLSAGRCFHDAWMSKPRRNLRPFFFLSTW